MGIGPVPAIRKCLERAGLAIHQVDRIEINEAIADGATNAQVNAAIDVSATKSFLIVSDQDVTVETNSGSTPDDTIDLVANQPYTWNPDAYDDFLLGTDVTAFFITNASGETATVQIEALIDATP
jgi:hypothetical protein